MSCVNLMYRFHACDGETAESIVCASQDNEIENQGLKFQVSECGRASLPSSFQ